MSASELTFAIITEKNAYNTTRGAVHKYYRDFFTTSKGFSAWKKRRLAVGGKSFYDAVVTVTKVKGYDNFVAKCAKLGITAPKLEDMQVSDFCFE